MKLKWLATLVLLFIMVWCGGVAAAPPSSNGDPDIWETTKPTHRPCAQNYTQGGTPSLVIDLGVFGTIQRGHVIRNAAATRMLPGTCGEARLRK